MKNKKQHALNGGNMATRLMTIALELISNPQTGISEKNGIVV
nr:MAG TPA: hypothetical protein [Caudoviricetes sp.]